MSDNQKNMVAAQPPVVGFLRLAGWSEDRIAEVVGAHERGEVYNASLTIGGPDHGAVKHWTTAKQSAPKDFSPGGSAGSGTTT